MDDENERHDMSDEEKEEQEGLIRFLDAWELRSEAEKVYWAFADAARRAAEKPKDASCRTALTKSAEPILELIDNYVFANGSQFVTSLTQEIFYRARAIESSQIAVSNYGGIETLEGFGELESREPPLGLNSAGRANQAGNSYLYLASDAATACAEIKPNLRSYISVAKFIVRKPMKIVDFADEKHFRMDESRKEGISLGRFFTLLMSGFFVPVYDEAGYRCTQIVSDSIRKHGIDGISYQSFYSESGTNYVFFNCARNDFEFQGHSKVYLYCGAQETFWDIEGNEAIHSSTSDAPGLTPDIAAKIRKSASIAALKAREQSGNK